MLPIILIGVIARLTVVSADCDIGKLNLNQTDWTNVSYSVKSHNVNNVKFRR